MVSSLFGRDRSAGSGTYIFYYRGVRDHQRRYPFTLEITPSQIVFFYSGRSFFTGKNDGQSGRIRRQEDYVSHPVLTIPTFSSTLEGRNSEAEIIAIFNDYIMVQDPLEDNRKFTTFSNLKKQGIPEKSVVIPDMHWENGPHKRITDRFQLRQLLLDFLFELRHENTFQENLPPDIYSSLIQWVEQYFILKAILTKYEYYYHRELVEQDWGDRIDDQLFTSLSEAELFLEAEFEWVAVVCSPEASMIFYTTDWFVDVEDEMACISYMEEACKRKCISRLKNGAKIRTDKHNFLRNRIDQSFEQIVLWWSARHHYTAAYKEVQRVLKFSKWFDWNWIVLLFLMAIFWAIFWNPQYIFHVALGYFMLWGSGLFVVVLRMFWKKKKVSLLALVFPATNTRLFLSAASFWIIIASTKDTWEMIYEMDLHLFLVSSAFILLFTLLLATYDVIIVTRSRRVTRIWRSLGRVAMLVFSGFFYAMLSGILIQEFLAKRTIVSSEINDELRYKTMMDNNGSQDAEMYKIGLQMSEGKNKRRSLLEAKQEQWSVLCKVLFTHPACKKIFPDTITSYCVQADRMVLNSRSVVMDAVNITPMSRLEEKDQSIIDYCNRFGKDAPGTANGLEFTEFIHRQSWLGGYIFSAFLIMGSLLSVFFSMIAIVLSEKRKLG